MVRAVHEVARYAKICIKYNSLISAKLRYFANLWSWRCWVLQISLYCQGRRGYAFTVVVKKIHVIQVIMDHIKEYDSRTTYWPRVSLFIYSSCVFSISGLSLHRSILRVKSQHIIIYCSGIFKSTLEFQILQHPQNMPWLVRLQMVYCYVVCRLYQHIPSFEDVIWFHGICMNVTSLMPVRKYGFHHADFHEIHKC
jgi:hypothetical protein